MSYLEHVSFHRDYQACRSVNAFVHFAVRTFAKNAELCVLAEFSLSQLNQRWSGYRDVDHISMAVLGEGITAHTGVTFSLVRLFQRLAKTLV